MRQDAKRTVRNDKIRKSIHDHVKKLKKAAVAGKKEELAALLKKAYSVIDMAFKKNILKRNTAARRKSLVARLVNKSSQVSAA